MFIYEVNHTKSFVKKQSSAGKLLRFAWKKDILLTVGTMTDYLSGSGFLPDGIFYRKKKGERHFGEIKE
ncbi:MAG: hypothetical protein LUI39_07850 [Lachnospiraceae bacterium]|nr:hypothetical protein [Lachnospiraceae bacterium]